MNDTPSPVFEDIATELKGPLFLYLRRMVRNDADAEDVLQETLIRIARNLQGFQQKSNVKTWAFRIATNAAIDFLRKSKKFTFVEFSEADDTSEFEEDDILVIDEMNSCIREVIDTLPPDYRAVLILYNLQNKSIPETAEICDISIPTAKIRIHRAKKRLQEALNQKCDFYSSPEGNIRCDRKSCEQ